MCATTSDIAASCDAAQRPALQARIARRRVDRDADARDEANRDREPAPMVRSQLSGMPKKRYTDPSSPLAGLI
jgi:hypothetical protein